MSAIIETTPLLRAAVTPLPQGESCRCRIFRITQPAAKASRR
jgi:hypothetical protein